jgi:hypothetical protein
MNHVPAIQQALYAHNHRESTTREEKLTAAIELAEWGIFSNRQIAGFTGLPRAAVDGISTKTDGTGGNLPGDSLEYILTVATRHNRGEVDEFSMWYAIVYGASTRMVARLTGVSQSAVSRAARKFAA